MALLTKLRPVYDSTNDKTVISFADDGDSSKGKAVVGTISGTSISFGSEVEYEQGQISHSGIAFDSDNGKVVVAYRQNASSGWQYGFQTMELLLLARFLEQAISFGTPVVFDDDRRLWRKHR